MSKTKATKVETTKNKRRVKNAPTKGRRAKSGRANLVSASNDGAPIPEHEMCCAEITPVCVLASIDGSIFCAEHQVQSQRALGMIIPDEDSDEQMEPLTDGNATVIGKGGQLEQAELHDQDAAPQAASDFLVFVGDAFYTAEQFIKEAGEMGISRRMPSHHLPHDLVSGQSRVFLAYGGKRTASDDDRTGKESEIFGYFVPSAVEFIAGEDGERIYTDIIAKLKLRHDSRIIGSVVNERPRYCGMRKVGGTYLVTNAESPLVLLKNDDGVAQITPFAGNHFRGLLRLTPEQATAIMDGVGVRTFVDESCMECGRAFKCAPDGHQRADRERRRMEKGEQPKWKLLCGECRKAVIAARAAANKVANEVKEAAT